MNVNFIHHLTCFLFLADRDQKMRPTHISLYLALFRQWNSFRFCETMSVNRLHIMASSKIGSRDCYYRVLKDLHDWGYLEYHPPNYPRDSAMVRMKKLSVEDAGTSLSAGNPKETGIINGQESEQQTCTKPGRFNKTTKAKTRNKGLPPTPEEVQAYFAKRRKPEDEATKFYLYYESTGWQQGGGVPIVNWMAVADWWMTRKPFKKWRNRPNQDDSETPMDYGAPL